MSIFLQLITDYGVGDPAFSEVIQRLLSLDENLIIHPTSVPSFSTLATGFWTAQFALSPHPSRFIIYTNTAPRKDSKQERKHNEGEKFIYALTDNGVEICGVNAGHCFSFIKHRLKILHEIKVANHGSQFRSRDFYPQAVVGLAHQNYKQYLGNKIPLSNIPDIPSQKLAFIDGYGNLKTTVRQQDLSFHSGQKVKITIRGIKRMSLYAGGTFQVKEGELAFAPGSTGEDGNRFVEIFLRGGSAYKYFDFPIIGDPLEFEKVL